MTEPITSLKLYHWAPRTAQNARSRVTMRFFVTFPWRRSDHSCFELVRANLPSITTGFKSAPSTTLMASGSTLLSDPRFGTGSRQKATSAIPQSRKPPTAVASTLKRHLQERRRKTRATAPREDRQLRLLHPKPRIAPLTFSCFLSGCHSFRSTTNGSSRAARHAGKTLAARATDTSTPTIAKTMRLRGSVGLVRTRSR